MNIRTILFYIAVIMLLGASKAHESNRLLQSGSSQAVVQFCARFSSRDLVGEKGVAESESYKASMATYFKTSGYFQIYIEMICLLKFFKAITRCQQASAMPKQ